MHISSALYSALRIVCAALCAALCIGAALPAPAAETPQEILAPSWFKPTFLDFPEDVREAAAAKKHLMIFITQNGCPWCKKLVEVNFRDKTIVARMQKEFDSVEINLHGSSETVWIDGARATEKALAAKISAQGACMIDCPVGGTVGPGTLLYALAIGPMVQLFLPYAIVELAVLAVDLASNQSAAERSGRGADSNSCAGVPSLVADDRAETRTGCGSTKRSSLCCPQRRSFAGG